MRNRLVIGLLISAAPVFTQPLQQVHPNPDCQFFFALQHNGHTVVVEAPTGSGFDNRQQGCTTWNMSYTNSGFGNLVLTLETAPDNAGEAGTFSAGFQVQQSTISGSNAATSTVAGFWWARGYAPWVRVHATNITGSGFIYGAVFGWRKPNAGGGGGGSITCLTGDVAAGSGSGCTTATVKGIETVPFCSGYTPTNGQFVQYTTGGSPNPCYSAIAQAWTDDGTEVYVTGRNVGINQSTPGAALHVVAQGSNRPTIWAVSANANGPASNLYNSNVPSAGAGLGIINLGYVDNSNNGRNATALAGFATQNWTIGTAQGAQLCYLVTANGSATSFTAACILQSGQMVIGNAGVDDGSGAFLQVHGAANANHIKGNGAAPTVAAGGAIGTTPTIAGTDFVGTVSVPSTAVTTGTIATVSFGTAYAVAPNCLVTQNGGIVSIGVGHGTPGTGSFTITAAIANVSAAAYSFDFVCSGN